MKDGTLVVSDSNNHCIQFFDGYVVVADSGNKRIGVFDKEGGFVSEWGVGVLSYPLSVVVAGDGGIIVCDNGLNQVLVFE